MKALSDKLIVIVFLAVAASLFVASFIFLDNFEQITSTTTTPTTTTTTTIVNKNNLQLSDGQHTAVLNVPAVDNLGRGVTTLLKVQAKPGDGKVLTDINQLFFWVDTQNSIRVARDVAQNFTSANISQIDLTYTIETNASAVEGPSAGAALAVATVAAVQSRTLRPDVMITGSRRSDGSIGKVDGIAEKAGAAKDVGAKIFLVPADQGVVNEYKPVTKCEEQGTPGSGFHQKYCSTEYVQKKTNIGEELGITVKEVSNLQEALEYFFV